jgi:AcrR family transcriptional regulator
MSPAGRTTDLELDAEDVISAAVEIFEQSGLDAVSMRSVANRLGVSPVPLYSRVGNKDALIGAIADRVFTDLAPPLVPDERWDEYALRWARQLRVRLRDAKESRLILAVRREPFVEASRPLIEAMRHDGLDADLAVQSCRLLMWATVGFVAVESGAQPAAGPRPRSARRPAADPAGVDSSDADQLFDLELRHLITGIIHDHGGQP